MNSVILIGRLARDPELSYTANTQTAMCRFTIAVDRPRRQGEEQGADFIRITVWGSYKNREGVTVYTTDVVADRVEFLGGGNGGQGVSRDTFTGREPSFGRMTQDTGFSAPQEAFGGFDDMPDTFQAAEDDIPF